MTGTKRIIFQEFQSSLKVLIKALKLLDFKRRKGRVFKELLPMIEFSTPNISRYISIILRKTYKILSLYDLVLLRNMSSLPHQAGLRQQASLWDFENIKHYNKIAAFY
ncbi:MAG: hypothetical protein WC139_13525 [Candidatus Kapaibacterium sp.]